MIYKIKMQKDDYFKISNKIISSNLIINDDEVTFEIEGGSYNILKRTNYEFKIIESMRSKILRLFSRYGLLVTGVLFLLSILYMNLYRVKTIEFNRETPINNEIEYRIKSSYKRLLCFDFCSLNYKEFSKDMQKTYFDYPFINISCKNNIISVYIASVDEANYIVDTPVVGDIVAKKDGVVDVFYVYSGKSMISKNKYVKKGDLLIEGNTSVRGLVMATTYDKMEIEILKEIKQEQLTEDKTSYYDISFFNMNFSLGKKETFDLYNREESQLFNLFDFFSLKKIAETKKNAIIKTYSKDTALEEAKKRIEEDFNAHMSNSLEKIIAITNTKTIETDDSYIFTFIVKKYESIGTLSKKE
ncbi:MAG: sporulation protein YqfD [Roseburia sp.]|nr:sporulation protein YqfD [Anaeroplasma bactoclasticum]MCM1197108.1 sporulation protein YqfD [Roseburia sp.]MCM1556501.1 sporulation protein YqfD [Anaeroplasma bactoclasticum]